MNERTPLTLPPGSLVFDLETDGFLDEVTQIHCLWIKDVTTGKLTGYRGRLLEGLQRLAHAPCLVGHNILKYDLRVIEKLYPTWKRPASIIDTMLCTRLIWPEAKRNDAAFRVKHPEFPTKLMGKHTLEAWGHRLGIHKGDYTSGWAAWSQEMDDYCRQDVEVTDAILQRVLAAKPGVGAIELEHQFQEAVIRLEDAGFYFDTDKAKDLLLVLSKRRDELTTALQNIYPNVGEVIGKKPLYYAHPEFPGQQFPTKKAVTEHAKFLGQKADPKLIVDGPVKREDILFNPGSAKHRAKVLMDQGWKPKAFTDGGDPQVDEASLELVRDKYPGVPEMIEYLIVQKRLGQVADGDNGWLRLVTPDHRIHGGIITNGCVTGRCSHIKPNLAQVPGCKDRFGQVQPYGKECRELFTVPEGYELVGCDASSLELRCLGHFLAQYDGGAYADLVVNGDVHTANQEAAGLPSRAMAKTFIYAYLYGAGDTKLGTIVGGGLKEGKRLRAAFQQKFAALKQLQDAIKHAVSTRGFLYGIDGRRLNIRSPHSALNTLLQSAGGLLMKKAFVILNQQLDAAGWVWGPQADWCSVGHIHDEFQSQVKKGKGQAFGEIAVDSISKAGQFYRFRVPIAGEFRVGRSWADTH